MTFDLVILYGLSGVKEGTLCAQYITKSMTQQNINALIHLMITFSQELTHVPEALIEADVITKQTFVCFYFYLNQWNLLFLFILSYCDTLHRGWRSLYCKCFSYISPHTHWH